MADLLNECVGDPADCSFSDDCLVHPIWVEDRRPCQAVARNQVRQTGCKSNN